MLFVGALDNGPLTFVIQIGAFGVGAFWLGHYGANPAITLLCQQATEPLASSAVFTVDPVAGGWGSGTQAFILRIRSAAPHNTALPCSMTISQSGSIIPARGPDGKYLNGSNPPYGSVQIGNWVNGLTQDFSFGVYL